MATDKHIKAADRVISSIDSLERILSQQFVTGVNTLDTFIGLSGNDRTEIENALIAKGLVISEVGAKITKLRGLRDYITTNTNFDSDITLS